MRLWRSHSIAPALLLALRIAGTAAQEQPTPAPGGEIRKITITARKYEFNPSKIELLAGQPVEITIQAEDATHGFTCKDLGVEKVIVEKGTSQTVRLTPAKPGKFVFKCAKFCGLGHGKMKGEILVTAPEPPR
jgi:cytochrome c oxidase subunit II